MLEFLPEEVRAGLDAAFHKAARRRSRLRLQVGPAVYPVRRLWHDGLALDAGLTPPRLRGHVDIYDGTRHIFQCLIVASAVEDGQLICTFKRATAVSDHAALDFWKDENAPVAYLPRR